jgi:hypothetical protein
MSFFSAKPDGLNWIESYESVDAASDRVAAPDAGTLVVQMAKRSHLPAR